MLARFPEEGKGNGVHGKAKSANSPHARSVGVAVACAFYCLAYPQKKKLLGGGVFQGQLTVVVLYDSRPLAIGYIG